MGFITFLNKIYDVTHDSIVYNMLFLINDEETEIADYIEGVDEIFDLIGGGEISYNPNYFTFLLGAKHNDPCLLKKYIEEKSKNIKQIRPKEYVKYRNLTEKECLNRAYELILNENELIKNTIRFKSFFLVED